MSEDIEKSCPLHPENSVFDCEKGRLGHKPCHFYNPNTRQCVIFDISENLKDIPQALSLLALEKHQPMKPPVIFSEIEEYVMEIANDSNSIFRGIVRATTAVYHDPLKNVIYKVISSYIVGDQIVGFEKEIFEAEEKAVGLIARIRYVCMDCLVDFRPGLMKYSYEKLNREE